MRLSLILLIGVFFTFQLSARGQVVVFIDPAERNSPAVGEEFSVDVRIQNVESLAGFEFQMAFNPEAIRFVSAAEGAFLKDAIGNTFPLEPRDDGNGNVFYAVAGIGGQGANGDGVLATLTFEVVALADSTLTLTEINLSDPAGQPIAIAEKREAVIRGALPLVIVAPEAGQVFEVVVGQQLTFEITVEGGMPPLTYSAKDLPEGATLDAAMFSWQPDAEQGGEVYTVELSVSDAAGQAASVSFSINVGATNRPPEWTQPPVAQTVDEGQSLAFTVEATDPDGDSLTYSSGDLPEGATFDPAAGAFSWQPDFEQAGSYALTFGVTDGQTALQETIEVQVNNVNRPPTLDEISDRTVEAESEPLTFTLVANDPDGDTIMYGAENLPDGATLDEATGAFAWTPTVAQGNQTYNITFAATDPNGLQDTQTIEITVTYLPPLQIVQPAPDQVFNTNEAETLTFAVEATGGTPPYLFSAADLPSGAVIDEVTGEFVWEPRFDQGGTYSISVTVGDQSQQEASVQISVQVNDVNRPPLFEETLPQTGIVGAEISFQLVASDPDGDVLDYAIENPPAGASVDAANGVFRWVPAARDVGVLTLEFSVSDGKGGRATQAVTVTVEPNDTTPPSGSIAIQGGPEVVSSRDITLVLAASDDGGGVVTMELRNDQSDWEQPRAFETNLDWRLTEGDGVKTVSVRYTDAIGNTSRSFAVQVTLDTTPPIIEHTPIATTPIATAIPVRVTVQDQLPTETQLYYRGGEASEFKRVVMHTSEALIPSVDVTSGGVVYYLEATDRIGNRTTLPQQGAFGIAVDGDFTQPAPLPEAAYHLISIPLIPNEPTLARHLNALFSEGDWAVFVWDGEQNVRTRPTIQPGSSYWLITKTPLALELAGRTQNPAEPIHIPLREGWNQVGNPFSFPVVWGNVRVADTSDNSQHDVLDAQTDADLLRGKFWAYEDTSSDDVTNGQYTALSDSASAWEPWKGYWVNARKPGLELVINPTAARPEVSDSPVANAAPTGATAFTATDSAFTVFVYAQQGKATTSRLHLGVAPNARTGYDFYDAEMPPMPFAPIRLSSTVGEGQYLYNVQPAFQTTTVWDITAQTTTTVAVTLHVTQQEAIPTLFHIYLEDWSAGLRVDLRRRNSYSYRPEVGEAERVFKLRVTRSPLGMELEGWLPPSAGLLQNYPNPFNPETWLPFRLAEAANTVITIYDASGRQIRELRLGVLPTGLYYSRQKAAYWDGRNRVGEPVASGAYFYMLTANDFSATRKMLVLR